MSQELIAHYRSIVEAEGIDRAREIFNNDVSRARGDIDRARQFAARKDWTISQRERYVLGVANSVNNLLARMRPIGRAYLSIDLA